MKSFMCNDCSWMAMIHLIAEEIVGVSSNVVASCAYLWWLLVHTKHYVVSITRKI